MNLIQHSKLLVFFLFSERFFLQTLPKFGFHQVEKTLT